MDNIFDGTERVIGLWFGKPLYRRVITISPPTTANTAEDIYSNLTEDIKLIDGYLLGTSNSKYGLNMYISSNDVICTFIGNNGHNIVQKISNYQTYLNGTNYIKIEYTKTTD